MTATMTIFQTRDARDPYARHNGQEVVDATPASGPYIQVTLACGASIGAYSWEVTTVARPQESPAAQTFPDHDALRAAIRADFLPAWAR
jgi:hypothetical protein